MFLSCTLDGFFTEVVAVHSGIAASMNDTYNAALLECICSNISLRSTLEFYLFCTYLKSLKVLANFQKIPPI